MILKETTVNASLLMYAHMWENFDICQCFTAGLSWLLSFVNGLYVNEILRVLHHAYCRYVSVIINPCNKSTLIT